MLTVIRKNHISFSVILLREFLTCEGLFWFYILLIIAVFFDVVFYAGNDFVVAFIVVVAVVVVVVVNFECVNFVALTASVDVTAAHALFVDFVPDVAEI